MHELFMCSLCPECICNMYTDFPNVDIVILSVYFFAFLRLLISLKLHVIMLAAEWEHTYLLNECLFFL